jgi:hypothetical protein
MNIACTWTRIVTPIPKGGYPTGPLNFWVAVDPFNTGIWQNRFRARRPQISTQVNVNLIRIGSSAATSNVANRLNPSAQLFFKVPLLSVVSKSGYTNQVAGSILSDQVMAGVQTTSSVVPYQCTYAKDTVNNVGALDNRGWYLANMPSGCVCAKFDVLTKNPAPSYCVTPPVSFIYLFKAALGLAMGLPASPTNNALDMSVIDVFYAGGSAARKLQQATGDLEDGPRQRRMEDAPGGATVTVPVGQPSIVLTVAVQASGDYDPVAGTGTIGYSTQQQQLQTLAITAISSGSVTKLIEQLTAYGDDVKAAFGSPFLGEPVPSDFPWADNSGVFSTYGNNPRGVSTCKPLPSCAYLDVSKFAGYFDGAFPYDATTYVPGSYFPSTDDGNANIGQGTYSDVATDDGSAGASFRKLAAMEGLAGEGPVPFDHEGVEVPALDTHACDVKKEHRALKGVPVPANRLPTNIPTPAPVVGYQPIIEFQQVQVPFTLQITTSRAPIQQVFAMFLMCSMWVLVLGQLLAFLPYFLRILKVDSFWVPLSVAPLIFSLTGLRSTMPEAPLVGAIFDFASYYWCLVVVAVNTIFVGVMYNLETLNRPAREKVYKANETEAKKLANVDLAKLTNEQVVHLFVNTQRQDWVPALLANKTTGKALKHVTKLEEMVDIVPGGPNWTAGLPKYELIADIKAWAEDGVDRSKLVSPSACIPFVVPPGVVSPPIVTQPENITTSTPDKDRSGPRREGEGQKEEGKCRGHGVWDVK